MNPLARWLTGRRSVIRATGATHRFLYRASRGRLGARFAGLRFLLLRTTGARSGKQRETPLLYLEDGGAIVVVASNGGQPRHPGWYFNILHTPDVQVVVGLEKWSARARVADPAERARLWPLLNEIYPYNVYQQRTAREIPVVILERT